MFLYWLKADRYFVFPHAPCSLLFALYSCSRSLLFIREVLVIASPAFRPAPMARMTVADPVTMSPPRRPPSYSCAGLRIGYDVTPLVVFKSGSWRELRICAGSDATTTISTSRTNSEPGWNGRRRPDSSARPVPFSGTSSADHPSSLPRISTGRVRKWNLIPSSSA